LIFVEYVRKCPFGLGKKKIHKVQSGNNPFVPKYFKYLL